MHSSRGRTTLRTTSILFASLVTLASCTHAGPGGRQGASAAHPVEPQGLAAFTRHSRFVDAKISPNGRYLAAISVEGGKRSLGIVDLADRKLASLFRPVPQSV